MAKVVPLSGRKRAHWKPGDGNRAMPHPFHPVELKRMLELAAEDHRSLEEVSYAYRTVQGWWQTRQQKRGDWPMVVINSMRAGWGLRGFTHYQQRDPDQSKINPRTGEKFSKRTRLTSDAIERLVRKHCEKYEMTVPASFDVPDEQQALL